MVSGIRDELDRFGSRGDVHKYHKYTRRTICVVLRNAIFLDATQLFYDALHINLHITGLSSTVQTSHVFIAQTLLRYTWLLVPCRLVYCTRTK